jgi:flagellar basal body-associated protein FliL
LKKPLLEIKICVKGGKMRDDENRKTRAIILVLVVMVVLLLGVVAYFAWIKPSYEKHILSKQTEAYNSGVAYAENVILNNMVAQIQQKGFVQIPLNENQTLYLAPFDPSQISPEPLSE